MDLKWHKQEDQAKIDPTEDNREIDGITRVETGKEDNRKNIQIGEGVQDPAPEGKEGREDGFERKYDDDIQPEELPPRNILHDTTFAREPG